MMYSAVDPLDQGPILAELRGVGLVAESLADLRESGVQYRDAIPVLLRWLPRVSDPRLKGEIVRALSVPWAKPLAIRAMIAEFREVSVEDDPSGLGLRWTIGNALSVLFDDAHYEELVDLAMDHRFGRAREMLVLGLAKSKNPQVVGVLLALVDDSGVDGHAIQALAKLRAAAARPAFEAKLDDTRAWVRKTARKALEKL
jgi:HEAT repeat protein